MSMTRITGGCAISAMPTITSWGSPARRPKPRRSRTELAAFLRDELKLTLSTEKTVITHARTHKARFLGYDIWTRQDDTWHTDGGRSINGRIALGVPPQAVNARCRNYQRGQGKPLIRNDLIRTSDYNIVAMFGTEYRGYVQYYQMAGNINWLNKLRWFMERSMMSTLAAKYRRPPWVMRNRYRTTVVTPHGKRRCFEATQRTPSGAVFTARFGGIPLRRRKHARLIDGAWPTRRGTQLIARLTAGICELCDSRDGITVHHVKRLADLDRYSATTAPTWVETMRDQPTEDPDRLRPLPRRASTSSRPRSSTTGEPGAGKLCAVSLGAGSPLQGAEVREEVTSGPPVLPGRESARGQQHGGKAVGREGVEGAAAQDPRDMAKAGLLEAQSPAVKRHTL